MIELASRPKLVSGMVRSMGVPAEPHPAQESQQARILWQLSLDAEIRVPPVALADSVVVATDRGRRTMLRRLSLETGADVWSTTLDHRAISGPVRTGTVLVLPMTNGAIAGLDLRTGSLLSPQWEPVDQTLTPPIAAWGGLVFARWGRDAAACLGCFAPGASAPLWTTDDPLGGADFAYYRRTAGRLIVAGNHPAKGMVVAALRPETGVSEWTYQDEDAACQHMWAMGGIVDVVTRTNIIGLDIETGAERSTRFAGFPLDTARVVGGYLVAMMEGHTGPVLLSFKSVSQALVGRVNEPMKALVGAHSDEVLVTLETGEPAFYTLPTLQPIGLPESDQIGTPRFVSFARDVAYVVAEHGRAITAIDLDSGRGLQH